MYYIAMTKARILSFWKKDDYNYLFLPHVLIHSATEVTVPVRKHRNTGLKRSEPDGKSATVAAATLAAFKTLPRLES